MGQAAPFALGLAMAQPERRVVLFTGDGELLMSLGVLATIATRAPRNLALVVLDNESYVETGGQPTATAGPTDLAAIARGAGIPDVRSVTASSALPELRAALREAEGPLFAVLKVAVEELPLTLPHSLDGVTAINRFRDAVLAPAGLKRRGAPRLPSRRPDARVPGRPAIHVVLARLRCRREGTCPKSTRSRSPSSSTG